MLILNESECIPLLALYQLGARNDNPVRTILFLDEIKKIRTLSNDELKIILGNIEKNNLIQGDQMWVKPTKYTESLIYQENNMSNIQQYSIDEKKAARFKLLEEVYNATGGSERQSVNVFEIGENLNFPRQLTSDTYQYLKSEGLIKPIAMGGLISITHYGIVEYEQAISNPESTTQYFPPVNIINNILNTDSINNTQVQIGTSDSSQQQSLSISNDNLPIIMDWINKLEEAIKTNSTIENDKIQNEIDTIKALSQTNNPNFSFIKSSLDTIKNLLIGVSSNAIFHGLLQSFPF